MPPRSPWRCRWSSTCSRPDITCGSPSADYSRVDARPHRPTPLVDHEPVRTRPTCRSGSWLEGGRGRTTRRSARAVAAVAGRPGAASAAVPAGGPRARRAEHTHHSDHGTRERPRGVDGRSGSFRRRAGTPRSADQRPPRVVRGVAAEHRWPDRGASRRVVVGPGRSRSAPPVIAGGGRPVADGRRRLAPCAHGLAVGGERTPARPGRSSRS